MSDSSDARNVFIRRLIRRGHTSVLEHASATFHFSEISRALTHQLVRHRIASYSQQSQRYVKIGKQEDEKFSGIGGSFAEDHCVHPSTVYKFGMGDVYHKTLNFIETQYQALVDAGVPAEDARMLLPNATFTEIIMTANFREWRHFLDLRADSHAQWEIRQLAIKVHEKLNEIAPVVFGDYRHEADFNRLIKEKDNVKEEK